MQPQVLALVTARFRQSFRMVEERCALSHGCRQATCPCHLYDLQKDAFRGAGSCPRFEGL